ncbi:methylmalonyl-CoA mutase [Frankineae bacterium MT45]|nr:methylmalonyl-CoA mutase [Frankineae bacterium MT45]
MLRDWFQVTALHVPKHPVRVLTAAALFDGHDAAINIMRRILQAQGAEVIHLGHNRCVDEVVTAAIQEDVQAIAISSYQGGHLEYFEYLVQLLAQRGAGQIAVYGGGGGTIVPEEIERLHASGVRRIFSPQDGQRLGLGAMVNTIIAENDHALPAPRGELFSRLVAGETGALARCISLLESGQLGPEDLPDLPGSGPSVVLGITGTGGSGKSSLTDELIRRVRLDQRDAIRIAVLAVDPTRRRGGGALLGDRIRMNSLDDDRVYFRSLATRSSGSEVPSCLPEAIAACRAAGFGLIIVETPGIGQGDDAIVPFVDASLYVMTAEFGAASQLEKIGMLDYADVVAINKFERRGSEDARRDVARQLLRNREAFGQSWEEMPVFGTSAASFNDDGVTALYQQLREVLTEKGLPFAAGALEPVAVRSSSGLSTPVPAERVRYLAEIAATVRAYHAETELESGRVRELQALQTVRDLLPPSEDLRVALERSETSISNETRRLLVDWEQRALEYSGSSLSVGGRAQTLTRTTLSGSEIRRVSLPKYSDRGDLLRFLRAENLPGYFPYTAGVFPFKREGEDPARMFAGEGDAFRTNRRFHLLSEGQPATRLSTAFDSVTLYGCDPQERPDVYGKVGTSGVSIATLEDMKALYDGFDLLAPSTSVSMTINGPAPTLLAFFLNTAIDQQLEAFRVAHGREASGEEVAQLRANALRNVRGTVQADILKEDQGQNTCIFSTDFSLRMMGDIAEWFVQNEVRNFYSVSISGYHIAEAGANPISQLAFTLANGFTYVESYLARGMKIDDFAPNLSFFFSNGMDAEYTVLGRVARRIWAIAMRDRYGANDRSQKLKYHVQTSGRSLHAQEMAFNDIRTTLQALNALYDNANSLHTNAYDEAVTTPSAESVRRALAIQLVITKEWGLSANENPLQGSFVVEELTDLVEAAVLAEFDRLTDRGGVLGAMESGYQRGRIQDESMRYEQGKHDGTLPLVGVNTFLSSASSSSSSASASEVGASPVLELARGTEAEKRSQLTRLADFKTAHADEAPAALRRLQEAAQKGENVFAVLMDAARVCTLNEITDAFFEVGGQYRRNV